MKKELIFLIFFSILAINLISAGSYNIEFNQVNKEIVIKESINGLQNKSYVDSESLNFAGNEIYFLNKVVFPENFENAKIILNLEKGIVVKNKEIFPLGYNFGTDGQTISISWDLNNVNQGDNFAIFVNLEDTTNKSLFPLVIFILIFISFGIFWFIILKRKKILTKKSVPKKVKRERVKESSNYYYLLDTEKSIIEELKKADRNELWQRQIQNSTGFSKAKISRLIRNLESRGLITKIPFGNTNKIRLK